MLAYLSVSIDHEFEELSCGTNFESVPLNAACNSTPGLTSEGIGFPSGIHFGNGSDIWERSLACMQNLEVLVLILGPISGVFSALRRGKGTLSDITRHFLILARSIHFQATAAPPGDIHTHGHACLCTYAHPRVRLILDTLVIGCMHTSNLLLVPSMHADLLCAFADNVLHSHATSLYSPSQ
jgi:hypothetical protein